MIIEFRIQNFLSVKDEQILNFEADKTDKKHSDYFVVNAGQYSLLKIMGIYGPNASGKTNILDALQAFRSMVGSRGLNAFVSPVFFAADPAYNSSHSKFSLDFLVFNSGHYVKYTYTVVFNSAAKKIISEKLAYFPKQREALIFERTLNEEEERGFTLKVPKSMNLKNADLEAMKANTMNHMLVLSCFSRLNLIFPQAKDAFMWFQSVLPPISPRTSIKSAKRWYDESPEGKKLLLQFLKQADLNISDIHIKKMDEDIAEEILNFFTLTKDIVKEEFVKEIQSAESELKNNMMRRDEFKITNYDVNLMHTSVTNENKEVTYSLPLLTESSGTQRLFDLAYPLLLSFIYPSVITIDGIESSLHLEIVKYFILTYLSNSQESQIIFTTHNLLLLEWDVLRNDTIWFTNKETDGTTALMPITSFNGINRQKILKQYLAGAFDALPNPRHFKFNCDALIEEEIQRGRRTERGRRC